MELNFSDYINDSVRILIILGAVKDKKASDMTEQRIMLYDYYLKFPLTMMDSFDGSLIELQTLDEYYSFFHWQPDIIRYRQSINCQLLNLLIGYLGRAALSELTFQEWYIQLNQQY